MIVAPDEQVVALMADPEYAEDLREKGGVWGYGFLRDYLPDVLAALEKTT